MNLFVIRSKYRNVFFCNRELSADGFGVYAGTINRLNDCRGVNPVPAVGVPSTSAVIENVTADAGNANPVADPLAVAVALDKLYKIGHVFPKFILLLKLAILAVAEVPPAASVTIVVDEEL